MLLRAFLKPSPCAACQTRLVSGFMPRSRYAKPTLLDKLHRKQKKAIREERQATVDRADSLMISTPSAQEPATQTSSSPLAFTISRTKSNNIPVYETSKGGGTKHITQLRKLSGNLDALVVSLRDVLQLPTSYVNGKGKEVQTIAINRLTKHVVVRGWRGAEVKKWAEGLGF